MQINTRMEVDEYFIKMARLASLRGACVRRQTGCILVNNLNHVLATGYNGRARGVRNCLEDPCGGAECDSGMDLERCEAIHAEANALLQCSNVEDIHTAYCTTAPCIHCVKLLSNTGCQRIVFQDTYPHMEESKKLWLESRFHEDYWEHFPDQMEIFEDKLLQPSKHVHMFEETDMPTPSDYTVIVECKCGLSKEVCK